MSSIASDGDLVGEVAAVIVANRAHLSEIDGRIGDGDHGVNMAKGFARAAERVEGRRLPLDAALSDLSEVLLTEIGGSMGPLYGMMFEGMAGALAGRPDIDASAFGAMLRAGLEEVQTIGAAKPGDKTMIDVLSPAVEAYEAALADGAGFPAALSAMVGAAEAGREATVDMVARIGRASRLGERSRGVPDAGATSCCLILTTLAEGVQRRLSA